LPSIYTKMSFGFIYTLGTFGGRPVRFGRPFEVRFGFRHNASIKLLHG